MASVSWTWPWPPADIAIVLVANCDQMIGQGLDQGLGDHGQPVLASLAVADGQLVAVEVEVLHPDSQGFQQAEAAAVQQGRDQARGTIHLPQQRADLVAREDDGQALGAAGVDDVAQPLELAAEHIPVQEEQRREGLVLSRCAGAEHGRQVRQECG
jgi:O-acetyl-ADP-ribose deacetylase (regulator of RNase III)